MTQAEALVAALDDAGYRLTEPRRAVAGLVAAREGHFTAADLEADARRRRLHIGRATIFRALDVFADLRLVERVDLPDGDHAYVGCDPEPAHHHHAICTRCGRSQDIEDLGLGAVLADVGDRLSFTVTSHRLELFGICGACHEAAATIVGRMTRARLRFGVLAMLAVLVIAGCGARGSTSQPTPTPDADAIRVVATTTVLADMVSQVGGTRVDVHSLVPKGGEVHTFDPTPADVEQITRADLIVRNGLGLDDWLTSLVEDAGTSAPVITLGDNLDGVTYLAGEGAPGTMNPHVWMNVAYGSKYVDRIEAALTAAHPADGALFSQRADAYRTRLAALDTQIRDRLAAVPEADRAVVSFHDAFPYFAAAYGLTIVGTVVDAPGQDPSAGAIGKLIHEMQAAGAHVIFSEAQFNDALVQAIAADAGAIVVNDLYDDTLGNAPADTYEGMMGWNADRVIEAVTAH